MVFVWFGFGFSMVGVWFSSGSSLGLLWVELGFSLVFGCSCVLVCLYFSFISGLVMF